MAASAENATERVVVLMTAQQKAELTRRARRAQVPVSEFIRQRALDDDQSAELASILAQLHAATAQASQSLERAAARLDQFEVDLPRRTEEARRRALAELVGLDPDAALAALLDGEGDAR